MQSDSQILISLHERFEQASGGHISYLSFDIGPEISHTSYSRTFKAVLGRPKGVRYLLEVVESPKLKDPIDFIQSAMLMVQLSHPNIGKIHTIFQEDEQLFLVREDCDAAVQSSAEWFRGLPSAAYGELFSQLVAAQTYFNTLGIPGTTLNIKPKHLFWTKGCLKVSKLASLHRMYAKPTLGYFSVPECESTKEKIEVWNLGVFLVDLATGFSFEGLPRGDPPTKMLDRLTKKSGLEAEIRAVAAACLRDFPERVGLDDLKRSKLVKGEGFSPPPFSSNSFSLDQRHLMMEMSEVPKPSVISFEVSNKTSDVLPREKMMSIRQEKSEKNRSALFERLAELERRIQSLSDFRRRTEERAELFSRESPILGKDRETVEVLMEQVNRTVR